MFASIMRGAKYFTLKDRRYVVFLCLEENEMKFGALFGYVFSNSIKLTVYDPSKKYEVFYPENDFGDIFQFSNYDVLGVYCKGEYLSIEVAHNNYVNGG